MEAVIIGHPTNWDDSDTHATPLVQAFINRFKKVFPSIPIIKVDERFTSKLAHQTIMQSGLKKQDRRDKERVDTISATIILQYFMEEHRL